MMKRTRTIIFAAFFLMAAVITASAGHDANAAPVYEVPAQSGSSSNEHGTQASRRIYLYGEKHGEEKILEKEADLWYGYYHNEGLRHLFIEMPYYTAELLNLWMKSENDEILDAVYDDWKGSAAHNPSIKAFYQRIKKECPETVFHGTDVGHQYHTTGERYLTYLQDNQMEDSVQYRNTLEAIGQGKYYYDHADNPYRENKMAENFIREFESIGGESVMGIYGGAHIGIEAMEYTTQSVPSMANQLYASYGDMLQTEDLTWIAKEIEPERMDAITVAGKVYQAAYFGREDITGFQDFAYRDFWRLENAYDDFKDRPKTGDVLPYNNYPMQIRTGEVFLLEYAMTDGTVARMYYRSDGNKWEDLLSTEEFLVE